MAASCEIPLSEFWDMSFAELNTYAKAYANRKNNDWDNQIINTYLLSRWVWEKNVDYKKYLNKKQEEMSDKQMFNNIKALNALFGGDVIG